MRHASPEARRALRPFARKVKRGLKWTFVLIAILLAVFFVLVALERYEALTRLNAIAPTEALVESFDRVAHSYDKQDVAFKYPLTKWAETVAIYFDPSLPPWYREILEGQLPLLDRLTGLEFVVTDRFDRKRHMNIFYAETLEEKVGLARRFFGTEEDFTFLEESLCFGFANMNASGETESILIVYGADPGGVTAASCAVEEIVQSLGLRADRATYRPTLFSEWSMPREMPLNDQILLRALYDPAIKPGMTIDDTRRLVPGIIRRLVADVEARGAEALYQR